MFPVLVRIDNRKGLLRPGMNAEVEIHVGERRRGAWRCPTRRCAPARRGARRRRCWGSIRPSRCRQRAGRRQDGSAAALAREPARDSDSRGVSRYGRPAHRTGSHGAGRERHARQRCAGCAAAAGRPVPAQTVRSARAVHRVRASGTARPDAGLDPHRPHRHGLQRSARGTHGHRLGAGAAEREPGAVAAGVRGADQPDDRRRRPCPGMRQQGGGARAEPGSRSSAHQPGREPLDARRRDGRGRLPDHPGQQAAVGAHHARHHHRRRRGDHHGGAGHRRPEGGRGPDRGARAPMSSPCSPGRSGGRHPHHRPHHPEHRRLRGPAAGRPAAQGGRPRDQRRCR